ncbi:MAG: SAM-dependent methyltransferase [Rhodospirillales bacterium]|nr:SAM-dependent methyltransferase [Rhodospirillales bacterium]
MTALADEIRERIRRDGPLSVAAYMELCLSHPVHGYYRRGQPVGAAGDFITAPEVSQMFGELIGLWCAAVWQSMGRPQSVRLVELGPGRGTLLADALRAAEAVPAFRDAIEVHLVESSETLRAEQSARLGHAQPTWHESFETVPPGPVLVVANEFFDALPIRQFERIGDDWRERVVTLAPSSGALHFAAAAAAAPCSEESCLGVAPAGAIVEQAPAREALAATLGARVAADGGAALIVDYGHDRQGTGDTLQAVKRHRRHGVLDDPGDADLTAHVDFFALAAAARQAGAAAFGPVPQGEFLQALGIEARAARLRRNASAEQREAIDSALRRLIKPDQMGMLFKALAIAHPALGPPPGFEHLEQAAAP